MKKETQKVPPFYVVNKKETRYQEAVDRALGNKYQGLNRVIMLLREKKKPHDVSSIKFHLGIREKDIRYDEQIQRSLDEKESLIEATPKKIRVNPSKLVVKKQRRK